MAKVKRMKKHPPVMSWVPVVGPDGRTRMEMRWRVERARSKPSRDHAA